MKRTVPSPTFLISTLAHRICFNQIMVLPLISYYSIIGKISYSLQEIIYRHHTFYLSKSKSRKKIIMSGAGTGSLIFVFAPYLYLSYVAHSYVLVKLVNLKNSKKAKVLGVIDFLIFGVPTTWMILHGIFPWIIPSINLVDYLPFEPAWTLYRFVYHCFLGYFIGVFFAFLIVKLSEILHRKKIEQN